MASFANVPRLSCEKGASAPDRWIAWTANAHHTGNGNAHALNSIWVEWSPESRPAGERRLCLGPRPAMGTLSIRPEGEDEEGRSADGRARSLRVSGVCWYFEVRSGEAVLLSCNDLREVRFQAHTSGASGSRTRARRALASLQGSSPPTVLHARRAPPSRTCAFISCAVGSHIGGRPEAPLCVPWTLV